MGSLCATFRDYHRCARLLACYFDACGASVVTVPAPRSDEWLTAAQNIVQEVQAWCYDLGKIAVWSAMRR